MELHRDHVELSESTTSPLTRYLHDTERIIHEFPFDTIYLTTSCLKNVSNERKRVGYVFKQRVVR